MCLLRHSGLNLRFWFDEIIHFIKIRIKRIHIWVGKVLNKKNCVYWGRKTLSILSIISPWDDTLMGSITYNIFVLSIYNFYNFPRINCTDHIKLKASDFVIIVNVPVIIGYHSHSMVLHHVLLYWLNIYCNLFICSPRK